tara:strand:+ start:125 stop:466 length:342 start_codon:yes stop_codon:yes gene_type:complete
MKVKKFFGFFIAAGIISLASSCSKEEGCHECHLSLLDSNGVEIMWEITNSSGGEDFCGSELENAESASYVVIITDPLTSTDGSTVLPAGNYGPGSTDNTQYEIHCEDHGDHDH